MMNSGLISVIVPVYNVEKYIERCLNSIVNQTYKELEIILVDDGSTDTSGVLCDYYASKDSRVCVIHQNNQGLSEARNSGMKIASGEYISFVDSDDFLDLRFFEEMLTKLISTDSDIVVCGINYCDEHDSYMSNSVVINEETLLGIEQLKVLLCDSKKFSTTAWAKIYKRELFTGITYPKGKYHEDVFTTYKVVDRSKQSVIIPKALYWYRQINNGITHSRFQKKHLDSVDATKERADYLAFKYPELKRLAYSTIAYSSVKLLEKMIVDDYHDKQIEKELKYEIRTNLISLLLVGNYGLSTKVFALFSSVSIGFTRFLFCTTNRFRK